MFDSFRLLFWTDHASTPAFVKKANMDGSNIQNVVQSGLVWPNGLAIDTEGDISILQNFTCKRYYKYCLGLN